MSCLYWMSKFATKRLQCIKKLMFWHNLTLQTSEHATTQINYSFNIVNSGSVVKLHFQNGHRSILAPLDLRFHSSVSWKSTSKSWLIDVQPTIDGCFTVILHKDTDSSSHTDHSSFFLWTKTTLSVNCNHQGVRSSRLIVSVWHWWIYKPHCCHRSWMQQVGNDF